MIAASVLSAGYSPAAHSSPVHPNGPLVPGGAKYRRAQLAGVMLILLGKTACSVSTLSRPEESQVLLLKRRGQEDM